VPRGLDVLVAATLLAACGAAPPASRVHHRGGERLLDLGELELVLDPTTDERFVRAVDRQGDHVLAFAEKDAEGDWARVEVHRFAIDPASARTIEVHPERLKGRYIPDRPTRTASAAGTRAWTTDTSLPHGIHEEDEPGGGRSMIEDLPRYQWFAALLTPRAVVVVIYIADLARPGDRDLDPAEALRQGRARHAARASGLLERLRRRPR